MAFDSKKYFRDAVGKKPDLTNYMYYEFAFSDSEVERVLELAKEIKPTMGTVGNGAVINSMRSSELKWFDMNDSKYNWLYEKLAWHVADANKILWGFNVSGFTEAAQFTTYHAHQEGHYHFHADVGQDSFYRKVSMTIQLTDPSEYDGGDLQFLTVKEPFNVTRKKGAAIVFPSYLIHRVTPVTRGKRDSLVIWASGPPFV